LSEEKAGISAIDAIYEILNEIKVIKKQIIVINNDIKILSNKLNKVQDLPIQAAQVNPESSAPKAQAANSSLNMVKIFGKVTNQRKEPIKGVKITVFSPKGEELKTRETDANGYWEARVLPGLYSVELNASHINSKFRPINRNISVEDYMVELEVK